jgi:hypothetical protein
MRKLLIIPVLLIFVSCSSIKIAYDFDKEADFSKYKTYEFSEETLNLKIDQLNRNRLIKAVETEMATKGFTKSENADAIIDLRLKERKYKLQLRQQPVLMVGTVTDMAGGGMAEGFANTQINYDKYVEGTLFITLIDKAGQKVIWQGTGTKTIDEKASPQKREENINYAVKQIFSNYPPGAK